MRRIVKEKHPDEPPHRGIAHLVHHSLVKNAPVETNEEPAHVELEVKSASRSIRSDPAREGPETLDRSVRPFPFAARVGVVAETPFPDGLEMGDQEVMHHPISKIGRKDLPTFRLLHQKSTEATRLISPRFELFVQCQKVVLEILFENERVPAPNYLSTYYSPWTGHTKKLMNLKTSPVPVPLKLRLTPPSGLVLAVEDDQ